MKNKIDKQALREKIQGLKGLSNEDKSQLLALLAEQKKYGLVWEDSKEDAEEVLRENIPVLREVVEKRLDDGGDDAPNHILIEGDNLHALTALTYTHEGKVDVIYIDPPYNTGNKDFVYNDSFVDSEDSYRHSKWLSFMEKRLKIAKKLLSDKGVIFISIDDNEQANLKLLCDDLMDGHNLLAQVIPICNPGGRDYKQIAVQHEYLLIYGNGENAELNEIEKDAEFDCSDKKGGYELRELRNRNPKFHRGNRPNLFYPFYVNPKVIDKYGCCKVSLEENEFFNVKVCPYNSQGVESVWRWGMPKSLSNLHDDIELSEIVARQKKDGGWNIYEKCRKQTSKAKSIWNETEMRTEDGTRLMRSIFDHNVFDHPKPIGLLLRCLQLGTSENSIILDFFAGSGTTLHATMQLNAEDGGHRQCILVTNNENNICEEVTYERNKRVINGYTTPKGVLVEGLKANNLRYYQMDLLSHDGSHQSRKEIAYAMTDLLCIKEGIYDEQDAFGNLSLVGKSKMLRYFAEDGKQMLLIYDSRVIPFIVKEIKQMDKPENDIKIYIFADGSYPYTADFDDVLDKVSLIAMPYAMDRALKLVLPEKEDIELEVEPEIVEDNA